MMEFDGPAYIWRIVAHQCDAEILGLGRGDILWEYGILKIFTLESLIIHVARNPCKFAHLDPQARYNNIYEVCRVLHR